MTEVLRGASNASEATGCSVIFKGGTSLSKAYRIIRRFSEDVDLVVVLPESSKGAKDSTLKTFVAAAESTTGVKGTVDPSSATKGVKRTATFAYPTTHGSALKPGVLMELGTRVSSPLARFGSRSCTARGPMHRMAALEILPPTIISG